MLQLQRSIMCTGLLSFVRYCGGVVHSGEHTLTDWGVGHLCVCVCVACACVCVRVRVCVCVCMCGMWVGVWVCAHASVYSG